jgi:D-alanine-D-alanine ligase
VKPSRLGSSVGISKATDGEQLAKAVGVAEVHDPRVIIEAASTGIEVECAVLGNDKPDASQPGEIVAHADWYDYEAKYSPGGMELEFPARLDEAVREQVRALAIEVFKLVDCAGLARVDFFVGPAGNVLVNEVNTMPGFTPISMFPRMWAATGVDYPQLVDRLITAALRRAAR